MLFLFTVVEHKRNGLRLILWSLIGLTVTQLYLYDYNFARSPLAARVFDTRVFSSYVGYVFSYLGSPPSDIRSTTPIRTTYDL